MSPDTNIGLASVEAPPLMSRLALGTYPLGGGYGAVDKAAVKATIDAALDVGWTFIDTAETYLAAEELVGRILGARRDRVFLATKAFPCESFSRKHLNSALESSLRRLHTDRVDLYQLHGPQDWVTTFDDAVDLDELAEALDSLVQSGKAVRIGLCNFDGEAMAAVASRITIFSTQNLYSMLDRGAEGDSLHLPVERDLIPLAGRLGIAVLAFSPLSRGLLADNLDPYRTFAPDDERYFLPRYQPAIYPQYVRLARRLQDWASARGETLSRLAIAWTLANPGVTSTLIGAKSPDHVRSLVGADEWKLTVPDRAELDDILATVSEEARAAKMIAWEHFPAEALTALRNRRYSFERSS